MSVARARGTRWESQLVEFFNQHGFPFVERRALRGTKDAGDLILPGFVLEAKNCREWRLNEWMTDAAKKAIAEKVYRYVLLVKRKQHSVRDGYAVMPVWLLLELLAADFGAPRMLTESDSAEGALEADAAEARHTTKAAS